MPGFRYVFLMLGMHIGVADLLFFFKHGCCNQSVGENMLVGATTQEKRTGKSNIGYLI